MTYFFFILKVACWYHFPGKSEVHVFQTIANNNLVLLIGWSVWINCVNYTNMIDYFNDIPFLKFEMACWYHIFGKVRVFRQYLITIYCRKNGQFVPSMLFASRPVLLWFSSKHVISAVVPYKHHHTKDVCYLVYFICLVLQEKYRCVKTGISNI